MSDLSTTSYGRDNRCDNKCDNGFSPMILILLLLCGGDNCLLGGCNGSNSCNNNGLSGILPLILILSLCGGSF